MQIEISPADIDNYVREAVLKSTIGKSIIVEVDKEMGRLASSYNSAFKQGVTDIVNDVVKQELEKHREAIAIRVSKMLTPEVVSGIVEHGITKFIKDIKDAAEHARTCDSDWR